jgi:hypothetical protein
MYVTSFIFERDVTSFIFERDVTSFIFERDVTSFISQTNFLIYIVFNGQLFDHFIISQGSEKAIKAITNKMDEPNFQYSRVWRIFSDDLSSKIKGRFFMWVISSCYQISQKSNYQMFLHTLFLYWRGISQRGINLMCKMGQAVSSVTFWRKRGDKLDEYVDSTRQITKDFLTFFWIDNFSKQYIKTYLNKGSYISCNWTAMAVTKTSDLPIQYLPDKPAHPSADNFMNEEVLNSTVQEVNRAITEGTIYRANDEYHVPPLPPKTKKNEHNFSNDVLSNFFPLHILSDNIASDIGLDTILSSQIFPLMNSERYSVMKVDINIYTRLLKRLIPIERYKFFSKRLVLFLGTWHIFKVAAEVLWRSYLNTFIGPSFHQLFPQATILKKPKLSHIIHFFCLLMLSYNIWGALVNVAIKKLQQKMDTEQDEEEKERIQLYLTHTINLKYLFSYFIPMVLNYGSWIKGNSLSKIIHFQKMLIQLFLAHNSPTYARALSVSLVYYRYY